MSTKPKRCFVIMPISKTTVEHSEDYWRKHFETFLEPLIKECGNLEVFRSEPLRGDLVKQIIEDLCYSPIVVADLTDKNPNVFWELGVRQSFKHGTITIAEAGTKIPFDISTKATLYYYPKNHLKNEAFREKFKKAIKDCLSNPDSPDSQVLEVIPGRGVSHLVPPIHYNISPIYYEKNRPRVRFNIVNLGSFPAKTTVTVRAFLGERDLGLIEVPKRPYYSGKLLWNLNPGQMILGNFALKKEWIDSTERFRLQVQVTVIDVNNRPYEQLPICYSYVRDKNFWSVEPTSFNELRRFMT